MPEEKAKKMPWYKRPPSPLKSSRICAHMHALLLHLDLLIVELMKEQKTRGEISALHERIRKEVWAKAMYEEVRLAIIGRLASLSGSMSGNPLANRLIMPFNFSGKRGS